VKDNTPRFNRIIPAKKSVGPLNDVSDKRSSRVQKSNSMTKACFPFREKKEEISRYL